MGMIIVINVNDKSHPRWVICVSDREHEKSFALKMKYELCTQNCSWDVIFSFLSFQLISVIF